MPEWRKLFEEGSNKRSVFADLVRNGRLGSNDARTLEDAERDSYPYWGEQGSALRGTLVVAHKCAICILLHLEVQLD